MVPTRARHNFLPLSQMNPMYQMYQIHYTLHDWLYKDLRMAETYSL
jgi:hypothetical protein